MQIVSPYICRAKAKYMKIPVELMDKWSLLHSWGDQDKLADKTGLTTVTIRKILKGGECSDEQFELIAEFYKEKEDLINQYL